MQLVPFPFPFHSHPGKGKNDNKAKYQREQYQGGYFGFQTAGMIEWEQISKPQKIPGPKINLKKNPMSNFQAS